MKSYAAPIYDKALQGHVFKALQLEKEELCRINCYLEETCQSPWPLGMWTQRHRRQTTPRESGYLTRKDLSCNPGNVRNLLDAPGWSDVAFWVARWFCNPEVPGSNHPPYDQMDLCWAVPNSTPRLVNRQLVGLQPVGILSNFSVLFTMFVFFLYSIPNYHSKMLKTVKMLWFIVLNAMTLLSVMVRFFNILLWNKLPHNPLQG